MFHKKNEKYILKFYISSKDEKISEIELMNRPLTDQEIREINKDINKTTNQKFKVAISRDFFMTHADYVKLSEADRVKYTLRINSETIQGEFSKESLLDFQKFRTKLLSGRCFKWQSTSEFEQEIKMGFLDFEILKAGASKLELQKYFNKQFSNTIKDSKTGMYEETVQLKIFGNILDSVIIGFNDADKLVYVRDPQNQSKITYLR